MNLFSVQALPRIWETGRQKVIIGSSESMTNIVDGSTDFIMTSPPYWDLKNYGHAQQIGKSDYPTYLSRLAAVWAECYRIARPGAVMVININNRRHKKHFYPLAYDVVAQIKTTNTWSFWDQVIWYIPNALPQPNHYRERLLDNKFEFCLVFIKGTSDDYGFHKPRVRSKYAGKDNRVGKLNPAGRCLGNVIKIPAYRPPNIREQSYHVAAYPENLVAFFLSCYTEPGAVVVDPFLGSGTTLKVAEAMQRVGVGYELNDEFLPVIQQRISEHVHWEMPDFTNLDILK